MLKRAEMGKAMRSCYPKYVGPKKSHSGAVVETDFMGPDSQLQNDPVEDLVDVEFSRRVFQGHVDPISR